MEKYLNDINKTIIYTWIIPLFLMENYHVIVGTHSEPDAIAVYDDCNCNEDMQPF
jgi:hypothetical protein